MTVESFLVLAKLFPTLLQFESCSLKIFVKVQTHGVFQKFLHLVNIVFDKPQLSLSVIELVDKLITPREDSRVYNPVQFFLCLFELSLHIQQLLIFLVESVFIVDNLVAQELTSSAHLHFSIFYDASSTLF